MAGPLRCLRRLPLLLQRSALGVSRPPLQAPQVPPHCSRDTGAPWALQARSLATKKAKGEREGEDKDSCVPGRALRAPRVSPAAHSKLVVLLPTPLLSDPPLLTTSEVSVSPSTTPVLAWQSQNSAGEWPL